jgi:hypothetical protein
MLETDLHSGCITVLYHCFMSLINRPGAEVVRVSSLLVALLTFSPCKFSFLISPTLLLLSKDYEFQFRGRPLMWRS